MSIEDAAAELLFDLVLNPYVERCLDSQYGGFLVDFDALGQPDGAHHKTLEHAARTTLAFGQLCRARPTAGYERYFESGLRFLRECMWDSKHGGFFAIVERDGTPLWNGLKHPHGVTYALRSIALAGSLLGSREADRWLSEGLDWMNTVSWNPVHGGYTGTYRRDNTPYAPDERVPTDFGDDPLGLPVGMLEMNTQGDAIHMLHDALVFGDVSAVRATLLTLVDRVAASVQPNGALPFLLLPNWTPTPTPGRTGHQFQLVRRLVDAGRALERAEETWELALRLTLHGLRRCRHPVGGFPLEMSSVGHMWSTLGSSADARQWWVQLEALDAFSLMASHPMTPDDLAAELLGARDAQWSYFQSNFVDREYGGTFELAMPGDRSSVSEGRARTSVPKRFARRSTPTPGQRQTAKLHGWKDISHEVAVLLDLAQLSPVRA